MTNGMFSLGTPHTLSSDMAASVISAPIAVLAGNNIDISYSIENLGPDKAYGINYVINLPASVQFLSANDFCTHNSGTITCVLGDMDINASIPVGISVKTSTVEALTFTAAIASDTLDDPTSSNNQVQTVVDATTGLPNADIAVLASANPISLKEEKQTIISVELMNNGPHAASAAVLTINTPTGWEQRSLTISQGSCRIAGSSFICDVGDLNAGSSSVVKLDGTVDHAASVTFHVSGTAAENDPDTANNETDITVNFSKARTSLEKFFGCSLTNNINSKPMFDPTLLIVLLIAFYKVLRRASSNNRK